MSSYWSCTKFADWLRGKAKPLSATSEEWDAWDKKAKEKRIRYWLAEEGLDHLQQLLFSPATLYKYIRRYIRGPVEEPPKVFVLRKQLVKPEYIQCLPEHV